MSWWRALHTLALFWMMAGLGNTVVPVWKAWRAGDLDVKALLLSDAEHNQRTWLLPGMLAAMFTGYAWAAAADLNIVRTGWLLALQVVFLVDLFILLPLLGVGLRRVRLLALQSRKRGAVSDELRDAMADNAPLVLGTLIALSVPLMVWLPVFKPF